SYSGVSTVLVDASAEIEIKTSVDFCGCVFKLTGGLDPNTARIPRTLFKVTGSSIQVDPLEIDMSSMYKGSITAETVTGEPLPDGYYHLVTDKQINSRTSNPSEPSYYTQSFQVQRGEFNYPVGTNLRGENITRIEYRKNDAPIYLNNFIADGSSFTHQALFWVYRNKVTIDGVWVEGEIESTGLQSLIR